MNLLMNIAIKASNFIMALNNQFSQNAMEGGGGGSSMPSQATQSSAVASKVDTIVKSWIGPLFTVVGAIGAVYIVILAVQYAKSENDNKRAEVKSRITNCVIGVLSLLLIAALCFYVDWAGVAGIFGYASN